MDFNPFPSDFENDEEENEGKEYPKFSGMQPFLMTPNGLIPIPNNISFDKLLHHKKIEPICSIFNGEYSIYLLSYLENDSNRILLECKKNIEYKGNSNISLFDVYNYLNTTHFLNFLIAKKFKKCIWAYEGADIQIQIMTSDKESYSRLIIMIEPSECANWMIEYATNDIYYTTYTSMNSTIPGIPIMVKVIKGKSYYEPIISYDITLGFSMNSFISLTLITVVRISKIMLYKCGKSRLFGLFLILEEMLSAFHH